MFTWKATEDHLYFASPTDDDRKRAEPQTCVVANGCTAADDGALSSAVGDRCRDDETTVQAAARLLTEADAYIAKQAEQIRGLILDNEFNDNCGEFSVVLSADSAAVVGLPAYVGRRVAVVVNNGQWFVRVGSTLYPLVKDSAHRLDTSDLLEYALLFLMRDGPVKIDETAMAQNAAGGVA
jgi:hypothetical protein